MSKHSAKRCEDTSRQHKDKHIHSASALNNSLFVMLSQIKYRVHRKQPQIVIDIDILIMSRRLTFVFTHLSPTLRIYCRVAAYSLTQDIKTQALLVTLDTGHSDLEITTFFVVAKSLVFWVRKELMAPSS